MFYGEILVQILHNLGGILLLKIYLMKFSMHYCAQLLVYVVSRHENILR